jgi:hypothetical protein
MSRRVVGFCWPLTPSDKQANNLKTYATTSECRSPPRTSVKAEGNSSCHHRESDNKTANLPKPSFTVVKTQVLHGGIGHAALHTSTMDALVFSHFDYPLGCSWASFFVSSQQRWMRKRANKSSFNRDYFSIIWLLFRLLGTLSGAAWGRRHSVGLLDNFLRHRTNLSQPFASLLKNYQPHANWMQNGGDQLGLGN